MLHRSRNLPLQRRTHRIPNNQSHPFPDSQPYAFPHNQSHPFPDSQAHAFPHNQSHPFPDSQPYAFPHNQSHPFPDSQAHAFPHNQSHPFPDSQPYAFPHNQSHPFPDSQPHAFPHNQSHPFPDSQAHAFPHNQSHPFPDSQAHAFPHTQSHPFPDSQARAFPHNQSHPFPDSQPHAFPHNQSHPFPDSQPHAFPHNQSHPFPDSQPHAFPHNQSHPFPDSQPHAFPHNQSHPFPDSQAHAFPHTQSHPLADSQPHPLTNAQPHLIPHSFPDQRTTLRSGRFAMPRRQPLLLSGWLLWFRRRGVTQQDEEIRSRLLGVFAGEGGLARVQRLVLTNPTFRMYQRNLAAGLREGACQLVSLPNSKIPESTRSCLCTGSDDVFLHCELQLEKLLTAPTAAPDSTRRHRRHLATTSGPAASNDNFSMTIGGRHKGSSAIDSPLAKLARKMLQTVSGSPPSPSDDDDGGIQGICEGGNPIESLKQLTSFFAFDWDSPPPETACCGIEQCFPVTKPPVLDLCLSAEVCVPPAIAFGELAGVALCPDGIPDDIEEGLASGLCTMLEDKTRQAIVAQAKEFEITLAAKLCIGGYILDKLPGWFLKALDWLGIDFCFAGAQLRYQPMTGFLRAEIWAKFGGSVLGLKVTLAIEAQLSDTTKNKYDLCSSATCSEEEFCRMCAGEERGTIELKVSYLVLRSKSWEWSIGDGDRDGCCGGGALSEGDREEVMDALRETNSSTILLSQQGDETWEPSKLYKWNDFLAALDTVSTTGIGEELFWLGDDSENGLEYGLVNVAAFLAQSMKETIMFDACDENSWDRDSDPKYSAANACGQLGQSYQDYKCKAEEAHMACAVDPDMEIRGKTHATWWGAPPPLFCAPRSKVPKAPKWNYLTPNCDPEVERDTDLSLQEYLQYVSSEPTEEEDICRDYEGQRAGRWEFCDGEACPNPAAPNFDRPARTDVEGCCWWGRGVIQTSGVCNFGKLNYYLGAGANQRGADALFPDTDFCRNPQAICDDENPTIKWISGMFFWMQEVQQYNEGGWSYREQVKAWVDGGMECPDEFIFGASGIVNRGCHNPPECGTGELDGAYQRATNFVTVLEAMGFDIDRSCNRPPAGGGSSTSRCGASWTAANSICGTTCAPHPISNTQPHPISNAQPHPISNTQPHPISNAQPHPISNAQPHPISNAQPHPISNAQPHPISNAQPHPISNAQPHPISDAQPHPISNAQPHPLSNAQPHPISDAQPHPISNAQPQPISNAQPHPISNAQPHPISDAQPHPISNAQPHPLSNAQPHPISNTQPHPLTHAYPFSGTYTLTASSQ
eukprot:jgi/Tetstr1/435796/TSEL_024685.t1